MQQINIDAILSSYHIKIIIIKYNLFLETTVFTSSVFFLYKYFLCNWKTYPQNKNKIKSIVKRQTQEVGDTEKNEKLPNHSGDYYIHIGRPKLNHDISAGEANIWIHT